MSTMTERPGSVPIKCEMAGLLETNEMCCARLAIQNLIVDTQRLDTGMAVGCRETDGEHTCCLHMLWWTGYRRADDLTGYLFVFNCKGHLTTFNS